MIYVILEDGEPYTYHTTQAEAHAYLLDLRRVYPLSDWDCNPLTPGRLRGQMQMIWGAECLVDLLDLSVHQWMKVYLWKDDVWTPPALHVEMYRFLPMSFENTSESSGVHQIRSRLKDMQFKQIDGTADRVVRIL